jgi:hypothetical protein
VGSAPSSLPPPILAYEPGYVLLEDLAHDAELAHPGFCFHAELTVYAHVDRLYRAKEPFEFFLPRDHVDVFHYSIAIGEGEDRTHLGRARRSIDCNVTSSSTPSASTRRVDARTASANFSKGRVNSSTSTSMTCSLADDFTSVSCRGSQTFSFGRGGALGATSCLFCLTLLL